MKKKVILLLAIMGFVFTSAFVSYAASNHSSDEEDWFCDEEDEEGDGLYLALGADRYLEKGDDYATLDGQPVSGWCEYWKRTEEVLISVYEFQEIEYTMWIYGLPGTNGRLLTNSWILDNGQVYYLGYSGITTHHESMRFSETNNPEHPNSIYNVQTNMFEELPYKLEGNELFIMMPYSGAISLDSFLYELSGQQYEDWKAANQEWINNLGKSQPSMTAEEEETLWNTAAMYIPQAMEKTKPGVPYTVQGRSQIMPALLGGHYVYFKVYIPSEHHMGSLKISVLQDGKYHDASFY